MTIQEYSNLMGYAQDCTMEEYTAANTAYMMAGDMDKATFCKEWKKVGDSPLARILAKKANDLDVAYCEMRKKREEAIVEALSNCPECSSRLTETFARQIGAANLIRIKASERLPLTDKELDYIARNI